MSKTLNQQTELATYGTESVKGSRIQLLEDYFLSKNDSTRLSLTVLFRKTTHLSRLKSFPMKICLQTFHCPQQTETIESQPIGFI